MASRISHTTTIGFAVDIQYTDGRRKHYSPTVASFGRYVRTLAAMGWSEKKLGYGMSLRMPPAMARRAAREAGRIAHDMSYSGSQDYQQDMES